KRNRVILVPVPRIVVPLERNHLRKLIVTLALALLVPTVAAATSSRPQSGRFSGYVAVKKVNGFSDVVTFVVRPKSLMNFSFGTLGCFGYGNFPAGVDPFSTSLASIGTVPMTAAGTFAVKSVKASYNGGDASTKLFVTISGQFTSPQNGSGTIWITETGQNDAKCGPQKMNFTVSPGNISAGMNG